jgi:hypothetical protein
MKKLFLIIGILILLIIGYFFIIKNFTKQSEIVEEVPTPTIALPTISNDVSVDLKAKPGNKAVVLTIGNIPADIVSVEYEMTYTTGDGLPRGLNGGPIKLKGEKQLLRDLDLGTCSTGGKCVYDTGVNSINLTLKFNTLENASIFQKSYPL